MKARFCAIVPHLPSNAGAPPNHSLVPTRLPPQGERALASHLRGHRKEVVLATPRGHPGLPVQGRQFEAVGRQGVPCIVGRTT